MKIKVICIPKKTIKITLSIAFQIVLFILILNLTNNVYAAALSIKLEGLINK